VTTAAVIATAVTATVGLIVALALGWIRRGVTYVVASITNRLRADHATINTRQYATGTSGAMVFHLAVACAPARKLAEPRRLDPSMVEQFAHDTFPGVFPPDPENCVPTEIIRFRAPHPKSPSEGAVVVVWPRGLVECAVPVPHVLTEDKKRVVELSAVAHSMFTTVAKLEEHWFDRLFPRKRFRRRRMDWYVGLTSAVSTETFWTPLSAFSFPGRSPERRATDGYPVTPPSGYGGRALWNQRMTTDPAALVRLALHDLLERGGYWGCEASLDDLTATLAESTGQHAVG
jgi:hypothetical protein